MKFFCSSCGQKLELPDDFEKESVFCPICDLHEMGCGIYGKLRCSYIYDNRFIDIINTKDKQEIIKTN